MKDQAENGKRQKVESLRAGRKKPTHEAMSSRRTKARGWVETPPGSFSFFPLVLRRQNTEQGKTKEKETFGERERESERDV